MTENQVFSCLGFIVSAFVVLTLQACGSTGDAPYSVNNSSSQGSSVISGNYSTPGPSAQTTGAPQQSASTAQAGAGASCYTNSGYAVADGATVWSLCIWPRTPADICQLGVLGSYFTCRNGAWAPQ